MTDAEREFWFNIRLDIIDGSCEHCPAYSDCNGIGYSNAEWCVLCLAAAHAKTQPDYKAIIEDVFIAMEDLKCPPRNVWNCKHIKCVDCWRDYIKNKYGYEGGEQ